MYLTPSTANLGVGTTTPLAGYKLFVQDTTPILGIMRTGSSGTISMFQDSAPWEYTRVINEEGASTFTGGYDVHLVGDGNASPFWQGGVFVESNNTMSEYASGAGNKALLTIRMDADGSPQTLMVVRGDNGNVGIGTTAPQYKLAVNGTIGTKEVTVTNTGWADYVFKPDYQLKPLTEVRDHIKKYGRLPGIQSEDEVKDKGIGLGEMQVKLLAKIEELTLHMIQAEERNNRLAEQNQELRKQNLAIQGRIARLESRLIERRSND